MKQEWWQDRAKVREVIELERISSAIQNDIEQAEYAGNERRCLELCALKWKTVRAKLNIMESNG